MVKMRSRSKDEMLSDAYNKEVINDKLLETETPGDDYMSDDQVHKLWAEHMHDFVPEDMFNTIIDQGATNAFFEDISHTTPTKVKGAYYVMGGNKDKTISCVIYDPQRNVVYKRQSSAQGIIIFDTTGPGEYTVVFSNNMYTGELVVTLALHTYDENREVPIKYDIDPETGKRFEIQREPTKEDAVNDAIGGDENSAASDEEVAVVRKMLKEIQNASKQVLNESKMSFMRQTGHN